MIYTTGLIRRCHGITLSGIAGGTGIMTGHGTLPGIIVIMRIIPTGMDMTLIITAIPIITRITMRPTGVSCIRSGGISAEEIHSSPGKPITAWENARRRTEPGSATAERRLPRQVIVPPVLVRLLLLCVQKGLTTADDQPQ